MIAGLLCPPPWQNCYCYEVLGLTETASPDEIRAAFLEMRINPHHSLALHPLVLTCCLPVAETPPSPSLPFLLLHLLAFKPGVEEQDLIGSRRVLCLIHWSSGLNCLVDS